MSMRGAIEETASPKYAHIERERRWLVNASARPVLCDQNYILIEDRYINDARMRLRKMTDSGTGKTVSKLTKKYECPDPLARPIVTFYLTDTEYALLAKLPARALIKRRYGVDENNIQWSLDCFDGTLEGLELLEIEWPDDAGLRELNPPAWVITEVSDDIYYQGGMLVEHGIPEK